MKRLMVGSLLALAMLLAAPGALAFPEISECKGALEPSKVNACDGVGWEGCCDVTGRQFWCEGDDLYCVDCANGFPACGWNPYGYYDCGQAPMSEDPTGEHPYACGACDPACSEGAGCSANCPGGCGVCAGDAVCMDDGSCYTPQCAGKECGTDPQGFSCGTCAAGDSCLESVGQCMTLPQACVPHDGPGCDGCSCEACVCETYPTCCTENWDLFCTAACELECGYDCSACPSDPSCDGIACGEFCGVDCGSCGGGEVCLSGTCCAPQCDGKNCGPDGCGGSCGSCEGSNLCSPGGVCGACEPSCEGKVCGGDGCGGSCGSCPSNQFCADEGSCAASACEPGCEQNKVDCGPDCECWCDSECFSYGDCCDGICSVCADKYEESCCAPQCDGKSCGGDGCGGSCGQCAAGLACEDGACTGCVPDCEGKTCGDDRCGGECGTCPDGEGCQAGTCVACDASCGGKNCGDDGCGGSCGHCEDDMACGDSGICVSDGSCGEITWDGCCWEGAVHWCENGVMVSDPCGDEACGWDTGEGYYDCGYEGTDPAGEVAYDCWEIPCTPKCDDKGCGADACGGVCGECGENEFCNIAQVCEEKDICGNIPAIGCCKDEVLFYCQADSQVVQVGCGLEPCGWDPNGDDGAGSYTCGEAGAEPSGKEIHSCDGSCYPVCHGKTCGGDGCGVSCGTCEEGVECIDGNCFDETICVPSCLERQCGGDGCGGSCGECPPGAGCLVAGLCAYIDDCETIGYEGVCVGDKIFWCEGGSVFTYDCDDLDKTCGPTEGVGQSCVDRPPCDAACGDRICGDNGCGGSCGSCADGESCLDGICGFGDGTTQTVGGKKSDSGCGGAPDGSQGQPWAWLMLAGLALGYAGSRRPI
jgi:hypothetical protein